MRFAQAPPLPAFEATVRPSPDHVRALEAALVAARAGEEQHCPLLQGFLLARPMPAPDVEALLAGGLASVA
jgi:hypothetical protein